MKKVISILLILSLCLYLLPMNDAIATSTLQYEAYAESLSKLGVFVGTGSGFELDREPTRIEGLVMLIRLLGVEKEAMALKDSVLPFSDVPKWATGYVAYAYENELTKGISSTKFGSSNTMEAKAFITFLLRSLDYNDSAGDFSYINAITFSKGIGLVSSSMYTTLSTSTFLRAHIAMTAYDTLKFPSKGTNIPLIDSLIAENKIDINIGNAFKSNVLAEPDTLTTESKTTVDIVKNADSIVMLTCTKSDGIFSGSGVITSSNGEIVTNYHVIDGSSSVVVNFNDGSKYTGAVYVQDYDEELDLAVLKIDKTNLKSVIIGNSDTIRQGETIVTIGSPYGYFNTVTEGIISAFRDGSIQISAAINPGSSGGGLFNTKGELIGITSSGVVEADNLAFAIPINKLSEISGKGMIPIISFYNSNSPSIATIEPPKNIRIVQEFDDSVHINWDPVSNADYYYFYYQEDGEEGFWYDEENGEKMKVYYNNEYSCYYYGLQPGIRYNIIVTSVSDGVQSADSEILSFVKRYSDSTPYYSIFYDNDYGVPDFGKIASCRPNYVGEESYSYLSTDIGKDDIYNYAQALIDNGFYYIESYNDDNGYVVMVYENYILNKTVMTGLTEFNSIESYTIAVFNEIFY